MKVTESRNKREGGYIGFRKLGPMVRFDRWPAGHQRAGKERVSSLRQWARWRTKNPGVGVAFSPTTADADPGTGVMHLEAP